jgi:hypothetical protein
MSLVRVTPRTPLTHNTNTKQSISPLPSKPTSPDAKRASSADPTVAALFSAIKKTQLGAVQLSEVPREVLLGESLTLEHWTMVLTDKNMEFLARATNTHPDHYCLDTKQIQLSRMFAPFFEYKHAPLGILSLNISHAKDITDYGLTCVARYCPNLSILNISGCGQLGDVSIREVAMNCPLLSRFIAVGCSAIEGSCFVAVAECCPRLKQVNMANCRGLKRWGVNKLFSACRL